MDPINELRQAAFEAAATVRIEERAVAAIEEEQAAARSAYRVLLDQSGNGENSDEHKANVKAADEKLSAYDPRVAAKRKIVEMAKEEKQKADERVHDEEARLAAATAAISETPTPSAVVLNNNHDADPSRGFRGHREFLQCVMDAGMGVRVDERLLPLRAAQGSDEQQAASQPYGGYLVPVGVAPGILMLEPEDDPLTPFIRNLPMRAPIVEFNARVDKDHATSVSGGLIVTRHPETVDAGSSRMKFDQVRMTANEEVGIAFATEKILTDSPESFVALLSAGFADEYVAAAMEERINGTGVGERQGVLTTPCLVTVAAEGGQAAATIITENIDKMAARCWRYTRAIWLANHNTRPQLRGLHRESSTPIGAWPIPYFSNNNGVELLDGRPLYFTEFAKTLGTVGDLILANWGEYLEGTYQTPRFDESIHVRFVALERAFRFYRRNDGQWWWKSALTPRNGDTLSPAVVLATRS